MATWRTVAASMTLASAVLAACSTAATSTASPSQTLKSSSPAGTVWLCRPGLAGDPCTGNLDLTIVPAHGARTVVRAPERQTSPFDCFYVYGTIGGQQTPNTNLAIEPGDVDLAVTQAQRFSQVCNVWAPIYRQRTMAVQNLGRAAAAAADNVAYASLLAGWTDYLRHDNHGRPVILIGHSQGAAVLIRLLAAQVDRDPSLRARLVLAILAGGNVTVPPGKTVGGSFRNIPLCTAQAQTGCVIAYSSFPSEPPLNATFGRPGQGVSLFAGQYATTGVQVACVNPAAIGGGTADLTPYFIDPRAGFPDPTSGALPADPQTAPWVAYPRLYSASCRSADGATWLQVTDIAAHGDTRPVVSEVRGPGWGYHPDDINLTLGNLITDVTHAEAAYTAAHH
jgi:hypothetical protein